MLKISERIKAEVLNYIIDDYASAKEGSVMFKGNVVFPQTITETLESLREEVLNTIDENNNDRVQLNSILAIIDENSNLDKLTSFSQSKRENEIYQDLLSEDDGENASELTELASERANDEFNDLVSLVKEDAVRLNELV